MTRAKHLERRFRMRRIVPRLSIVVCCSLLLMASCRGNGAMETQVVKSDKYVDIGTHKLRVVLSDVQSKYTIVLESGGGMYSNAYAAIQDTLATLTGMRVMSYDRSGFGQSELGPSEFNAIDEVDALKKCLEIQGFGGNFILVGHSYGGYLVQIFALRYPELVSGLVLIDPMNIRFIDRFGLDNLNAVTPYFENPTDNFQRAGNRMVDHFPESFEALRGKELPAEIPVILLTAGEFPFSPESIHPSG